MFSNRRFAFNLENVFIKKSETESHFHAHSLDFGQTPDGPRAAESGRVGSGRKMAALASFPVVFCFVFYFLFLMTVNQVLIKYLIQLFEMLSFNSSEASCIVAG